MRFGVGFQSHIGRSPKHAVLAESAGFDDAWFVDSQLISDRVLARVGPRIAVSLHYAYEQARAGKPVPEFVRPFMAPAYARYLDEHWAELHATHSRRLHPGEGGFITPDAIRAMSLTGTREEILERLHTLEAAGLTRFTISPPWDHVEENIVEFGREIVAKRGR